MHIQLPYGKGRLEGEIDDQKLQGYLQCPLKNHRRTVAETADRF